MAPRIAMAMPEGVPRLGRSPVQASILAPVDSHSVHPTGPAREGAQNITHSQLLNSGDRLREDPGKNCGTLANAD
jgi:hypothetical protein